MMKLNLSKNDLKLVLIAIPLSFSLITLIAFGATWPVIQQSDSETAKDLLLLYVSSVTPFLSACVLCLSSYLLWVFKKSTSSELKGEK